MSRTDQANGPVFFAPSKQIFFNGQELDPNNLVQFISGVQGIIYQSPMVVATALKLEAARYRNANSLIPAGVLQVTGGEPLSSQELADLAAAFNSARSTNQTAALSENLKYIETNATPDKMLLIDAANYQALECSRLTNVPSYLLGIAVGGYSYVSNQGARLDLWSFGAKAIAECIQNTLSMDNVLPRGTYVRFDSDDYLSAEYSKDMSEMAPTDMEEVS
jgi:phage portal protein BeeE